MPPFSFPALLSWEHTSPPDITCIVLYTYLYSECPSLKKVNKQEGVTVGLPTSWTQAIRLLPRPPLPHPRKYALPMVATMGAVPEAQPWDHPDSVYDWIHFRFLYKFLMFWQVGAETYLSWSPQDNLVSNFPCLLPLPPINLERHASVFDFSLSSMEAAQSTNQHLSFPSS